MELEPYWRKMLGGLWLAISIVLFIGWAWLSAWVGQSTGLIILVGFFAIGIYAAGAIAGLTSDTQNPTTISTWLSLLPFIPTILLIALIFRILSALN